MSSELMLHICSCDVLEIISQVDDEAKVTFEATVGIYKVLGEVVGMAKD